MPTAYKPGLVRIKPQYTYNNVTGEPDTPENVLWFLGSNLGAFPLNPTALQAIANTFDSDWGPVFTAYASSDARYIGCDVQDFSSNTGEEYSTVGVLTPVDGTQTGQTAADTAVLISWFSGTLPRYRGGHSRTYLPFLCSGLMTNAWEITTGTQTNLITALTNWQTEMAAISAGDGGPYQPVIFRFKNDPTKAALYIINEGRVNLQLASQRRRLRRVTRK